MTDLYLKTLTEEDMEAALVAAEMAYQDEEYGFQPANGVSLDVIGPIVRVTGYDEDGEPITVEYPEWHVNVRCTGLTEDQETALEAFIIVPPEIPYRVWA
jgi:hypothetical protein